MIKFCTLKTVQRWYRWGFASTQVNRFTDNRWDFKRKKWPQIRHCTSCCLYNKNVPENIILPTWFIKESGILSWSWIVFFQAIFYVFKKNSTCALTAVFNSSDKSFHQNELQSISLPAICYLSQQRASEGTQGCSNLMLHVLPFKRVIQTGPPSLPDENKPIKDSDWHCPIWPTRCGKFCPRLLCESAAGLTLNLPGPVWQWG